MGFIKNDKMFFNLLDSNKEVAGEICHKIGKVVASYEKLNRYQASPTMQDIENGVTEETLNSRIKRTEKDFFYYIIRLARENHIDMMYIREDEVDTLMNEVLTFIYAIRVTNAVYAM